MASTLDRFAQYFASVTSLGDVIHADTSVAADKSLNFTPAAELDEITAAEAGAPQSLSVPLQQLGADFQALETDTSSFTAGSPASTVAQQASAVAADYSKIQSVCS